MLYTSCTHTNGNFLFYHFRAAENRLGFLSNARVKIGLEYDYQLDRLFDTLPQECMMKYMHRKRLKFRSHFAIICCHVHGNAAQV